MCRDCSCGLPEAPPRRTVVLEAGLLARNDHQATHNRQRFEALQLPVVNVLSAPGSGKTALLEALSRRWNGRVGVIVGDLATDNDARRLREAGADAVQITTGQVCHLEASMVERAFQQLDPASLDLLLIENVGNLVCPAAFDLGEGRRLVLMAAGEGEDKPLKYPALFKSADAIVITKIDLAAAVAFEREQALANLAQVAPQARIFEVSARTGEGLEALMTWLGADPSRG
ncbi:MAG: hydrogenase nickel incorporation protein HypB [Synechococcaceae cyanobacterium ELA445]